MLAHWKAVGAPSLDHCTAIHPFQPSRGNPNRRQSPSHSLLRSTSNPNRQMAGLHSYKGQAILPPIFGLLLLISFGMPAVAGQREGLNLGGSPP